MARKPPRNRPPRVTRNQQHAAQAAARRRRSAAPPGQAKLRQAAERGPGAPPHNSAAEQALLGAILVNNAAYYRVSDFLLAEHFAEGRHGRIFAAIAKLIDRSQVADPVTLKTLFDQGGALTEIGGGEYLARLATSMVTIINAGDYGRTIYDLWQQRAEDASAKTSPSSVLPPEWEQERAAMLERLGAIEAALEQIAPIVERLEVGPPAAPGIGHNQSPEPLPIETEQIRIGISAANVLRTVLSEDRPRPEAIRLCGLVLRQVGRGIGALMKWVAAKGDALVDAAVKVGGRARWQDHHPSRRSGDRAQPVERRYRRYRRYRRARRAFLAGAGDLALIAPSKQRRVEHRRQPHPRLLELHAHHRPRQVLIRRPQRVGSVRPPTVDPSMDHWR
jgi:hypothetical protein